MGRRPKLVWEAVLPDMARRYEAGETSTAIAADYGVTPSSVLRHLRAAGVEIRRPGRPALPDGRPMKTRDPDRTEAMRRLYGSGKTLEEVGSVFGVSRERVRQLLARVGHDRRKPSGPRMLTRPTKGEVAEAIRAGKSVAEIAEEWGLTTQPIYERARRAGVEVVDPRVAQADARAAEVARLYMEGMKPAFIAERVGLRYTEGVYRYLQRAGVRPHREHREVTPEVADEMVSLYATGMSVTAIGEKAGFSHTTVTKHLRAAGVDIQRWTKVSREERQAYVRMKNSGRGVEEIAARYQRSAGTVCRHLRMAGVEVREPRPPRPPAPRRSVDGPAGRLHGALATAIVGAIVECGPLTPRAMVAALDGHGFDPDSITSSMRRLTARGHLVRMEDGRYRRAGE